MTPAPGLPQPLGFPSCASCPYLHVGTAAVCGACTAQTTTPVAEHHCPTCNQALEPGSACRNRLCWLPLSDRGFTHVSAIAMYTTPLNDVLRFFKYNQAGAGWALIFGRLIVGWLQRAAPSVTLIIGNPTASTRQPHQHIELIMQAAYVEDAARIWPIADPSEPVLIKSHDTTPSAGNSLTAKLAAAQEHAEAIAILRPERIRGARILLVDDLFTTGAQFQAVSHLLLQAGARDVQGLVLARTPWGS